MQQSRNIVQYFRGRGRWWVYGRMLTNVKVLMYRCLEMNAQRASAAQSGEGRVWPSGEGIGKLGITSQRNYNPFVVVHMDPRPSRQDPRQTEPARAVRVSGEMGRHDAPDGLLSFCSSGSSCGACG